LPLESTINRMGLQKSGTTDNFAFFYQNKDHLGTVRETVTSTGAMKQRVNYYPFGGQLVDTLKVMIWNRDFQQYKYNGKEFDGTFGLNTYDYGARQHDPILARWDRIDPLCEKYYGVSPYAYCANNPVKFIDPDGCEMGDYYNMSGKFIGTDGLDDQKKYIVLDNKEAKQIKNGNFTETSSAIPVPSKSQIGAAQTSIDQGQKTGNEYGFVMGSDGSASKQCVGKSGSVNLGPGYEEIGDNTVGDAHYHPYDLRMENGNPTFSTTDPSPEDFNNRTMRENNGVNSPNNPSWILGEEPSSRVFQLDSSGNLIPNPTTTSIRFYWGNNRQTEAYSWKKFKNAVNIINGGK